MKGSRYHRKGIGDDQETQHRGQDLRIVPEANK